MRTFVTCCFAFGISCIWPTLGFCRDPLAAATINGSMTLIYGSGGISNQTIPQSSSVNDRVFAVNNLDEADVSQGPAFVAYSGSAHAGHGTLGVQAFASANAPYPSFGETAGTSVLATISVKAEADLLDTLTFIPPICP